MFGVQLIGRFGVLRQFRSGLLLVLASAIMFSGCATRPDSGNGTLSTLEANDPLEGANRKLFSFNQSVDNVFLKPVARGYRDAVPGKARKSLRNFVRHLRSPVVLANDVLQGNFKRAGETTGRIIMNTTLGMGGFLDPAAEVGIAYHSEDFGQTLAVYGVPEGPYLYLPILGPLPPRDLAGFLVDFLFSPLFWSGDGFAGPLQTGRFVVDGIDTRERNLDQLDQLEETSLDYYAAICNLYRQSREFSVRNGENQFENLPDFEAFD